MDSIEELRRLPLVLPMIDAHRKTITHAADEIEHLRRALKFYADATAADFANDNGFNATAALASADSKS